MARFNGLAGRSPNNLAFRADSHTDRLASLESLAPGRVGEIMRATGKGERRAAADAERELGLGWRAGGFKDEVRGHARVNN